MNQKTFLFILFGVVIGLSGVYAGSQWIKPAYTFQGSVIEPALPADDFELTTQDGESFRLSDYQGEPVLMFFGYTNCPDVCPTTLYEYKRIASILGEESDQVVFTFITVDPQRDTPEQLKTYVQGFNSSFIGLTGTEDELEPVYQTFGVYHEIQESDSAAGYLVDHTARIYVLDRSGDLRLTFPFGMDVNAMADDIQHLLDEG